MEKVSYELRKNNIYCARVPVLMPFSHIHNEIEMVYVKNGSAKCYADNMVCEIADGDIFVCFPHQIHRYSDVENGEYYLMIFSPDIIYNQKNLFLNYIPKSNAVKPDTHCISGIVSAFSGDAGIYNDTMLAGLLNYLTALTLQATELTQRKNVNSPSVQAVMLYCNKNYASDITLDSIAEALHLSKYHISHIFSEKLGISFKKYINSLRIDEASKLMHKKENSLTFISEEVGFGSIRSFNRAFSEIMNTTPLKYRNQNIKAKP